LNCALFWHHNQQAGFMSQKFPADDFDLTTEVGGRHRAVRRGSDNLLEFAQVVIAGAVLSTGGFFGLQMISNGGNSGLDAGVRTVAASQFTKGNGIGVSVIDASAANDGASKLAQKLLDQGWNVWTAARSVNSVGNPAFTKTTIVYASSSSSVSAAKSLAASLGVNQTVESTAYADPITVVLGLDYNK
jgi:hypothetical protein